jgi:hypothetical protein
MTTTQSDKTLAETSPAARSTFSRDDWRLIDRFCAAVSACELLPSEVPDSPVQQLWADRLTEIEQRIFDPAVIADEDQRSLLARHHGYVRMLRFITRDDVSLVAAILRVTLSEHSSSWLRAYGAEVVNFATLMMASSEVQH